MKIPNSQGVPSDKEDKSVKVFFMVDFYCLKDASKDRIGYISQNFGQFEIKLKIIVLHIK